jgi:dethiobiotin synthetase
VHEDVVQLVAASNVRASREDVNPYCFEPPIAPHIAARQAGVEIELERIERSYRRLAASAEVVVVEGVGGLLVPIAERFDMAHLAERLALPVVLVVGLRLGCLNHALLTAAAIRARGLEFAGWVANQLDPRMDAVEENLAALRQRIGAPLWARIAHLPRPDFDAVARLLDAAAAS